MATAKKNGDVKTPEVVEENTALAARGENALAEVPDWMEGVQEDEPIAPEDIKMPRLAIAQGLSPAMIPGKPNYNEDLKLGQLYNSLNGEVFGRGPVQFAVAKRMPPRWVLFDDERNMIDPNVDPREHPDWVVWRDNPEDPNGKQLPPLATKFLDYVVILLDTMEPIAISCARSNINGAKQLNGLMQMRKPKMIGGKPVRIPEFAMRFTVETAMVPGPNNSTYGIFVFKNAGDLANEPEKARAMRAYHEQFSTTTITIDREVEDETAGGPRDSVEPPAGVGSTDFEAM